MMTKNDNHTAVTTTLLLAERLEGVTSNQLAKERGITLQSANATLNRMVSSGTLERRGSGGRGGYRYYRRLA